MQKKWVVSAKRADFQGIAKRFGIDQVTARIIRNRDVVGDEALKEYLYGSLEDLNDPAQMKDITLAAELLQEKIEQEKHIRILGDYAIDGVQSVYILYSALRRCHAQVDYAIPDRVADGYGLNERLVRQAKQQGTDTLLTCDNGIAAAKEIALAKELGMTVIVTDHHEVPYEEAEDGSRVYCIPPADAVVNPKQIDCCYPFKNLCGAAVVFKLVQVLYDLMGFPGEEALQYLENAAFATVGDVMDLQGENRILVKEGLKSLNHTKNYGMRALASRNQLAPGAIRAYHIGFVLGPCLNASGRLDTAKRALKMLLAEDEYQAAEYAGDLYDLNASRKEMTEQGVQQAKELIQQMGLERDKVLVIYLPDCHESLAGIIAGRIREQYNRPVFVLTRSGDGVKGSGRSIEQYSMFEEMSKCKELFTKYGGHPMAAGLSLPEEHVDVFRRKINENTTLTEEDLCGKIVIDVPMPLSYISKDFVEELNILEPFGKSNEKPLFADRDIEIISIRIVGKNQNVCKMQVKSAGSAVMTALYFGEPGRLFRFLEEKYGSRALEQAMAGMGGGMKVSLAYYPEVNRFNGRETIQIVVRYFC